MRGFLLMVVLLTTSFCEAGIFSRQSGSCGPEGCTPQSQASPQQYVPQTYGSNQALLYPFVADLATRTSGGSAVYVDLPGPQGTVISAAHCFDTSAGTITCTFPSGQKVNATIRHLDFRRDIAILSIPRPAGISPVRVADRQPTKGELTTLIGYGGNPRKGFFAHAAFVRSFDDNEVQVSSTSSQGDSGGCLLDARGQYLGVICRTSSLNGSPGYTMCARVRPIKHLFGYHPDPVQQQGYGGVAPVLPDTSNLVTRAEFEREKSRFEEAIQAIHKMQLDGGTTTNRLERVEALLKEYEENGADAAYQVMREYAIENFPPDLLNRLGRIEAAYQSIPAERRAEIAQAVVDRIGEVVPADLIGAVRELRTQADDTETAIEAVEDDVAEAAEEAAKEDGDEQSDGPLIATVLGAAAAIGVPGAMFASKGVKALEALKGRVAPAAAADPATAT